MKIKTTLSLLIITTLIITTLGFAAPVAGGFTEDRAPDQEELDIFETAMAELDGVQYKPMLVATQVVAGINYRFTCRATAVFPDAEPYNVYVFIYQPLDGDAELVEIVKIEEERTFDGKVLATMEMEVSAEEIKFFFQELLGVPIKDFLCFPTINDAVLALKTGKVDTLLSMSPAATLLAKLDPSLYTYMDPRLKDFADVSLSMVVMRANEALGLSLNAAIAELEENGMLQQLASGMFGGQPPEVPQTEITGAPLLVGVTGDIPPIDYVDMAGNPAGYNVNLMAQIGAILGRKIEFVQVNKGAAITALATGRIDILFWQEQAVTDEMRALTGELSENVFVTDPYLTLSVTAIELK